MNEARLANLKKEIDAVVDSWVSTVLKDRLIGGTNRSAPKSLWDRLKQGVANWWYGPQGEKDNPYRWQNRFGGSLGVSESFNPSMFTLHEYADIKGFVESIEQRINESSEGFDKLRIAQIIRSAAADLKAMLFNALKDLSVAPAGSQAEAPPVEVPTASPETNAAVASGPVTLPAPKKAQAKSLKTSGGASSSSSSSSVSSVEPKKEKTARRNPTKASGKKSGESESKPGASTTASSSTSSGGEVASSVNSAEDQGSDLLNSENENPELMSYIEKDGVKSLKRIGEKVSQFLDKLSEGEAGKRRELLLWWDKTWTENKKMVDKEERMEDIKAKLVSGNQYIEQIAKIAGIASQTVKQMMIEFIKEEDAQ